MNPEIEKSPFRNKGYIGNLIRRIIRSHRLYFSILTSGFKLRVGSHFSIGKNSDIRPTNYCICGNFIGIGKNFTCEADAIIGDYTLISSNVSFISNDHSFDDEKSNVYSQGRLQPQKIILEGDNLIGFGAILIAPCTVSKGAIIGSGAVVKGYVSQNSVYGGVPAKKIKNRFN